MRRNGKDVRLGAFASAEEAALCVARSQKGQAAAAQRAGDGADLAPSGLGVNAAPGATPMLLTLCSRLS